MNHNETGGELCEVLLQYRFHKQGNWEINEILARQHYDCQYQENWDFWIVKLFLTTFVLVSYVYLCLISSLSVKLQL